MQVALIAIMCSSTLRRKHPYNIMALFAFTCIMAVLVGTICSYWDVAVVLTALAVTAAAVAGLTVVAIFGKFDMTKRGGLLAMASMVVLFVLIVTLVIGFFYGELQPLFSIYITRGQLITCCCLTCRPHLPLRLQCPNGGTLR
jgi:FtsH-binding integral membrane protein